MKPRLILCPGYVISKFDDQAHYISEGQLAQLYGVPPELCTPHPGADKIGKHDVCLFPSYHGDYKLPADAAQLVEKLRKRSKK